MSYSTKALAQQAGQAVMRAIRTRGKLRLDGVKLSVRENIGWYWYLRHRHFGIFCSSSGKLHCLMGPDGYGTGRVGWAGDERGPFPDLLLRAQLRRAKAEIATLQRCVDEVEALLIVDRRPRRRGMIRG